jgi:hypothetical protein
LISSDISYPNVGWLAFGKFATSIGLLDKNLQIKDIDRLFIVVNYEVDSHMDDNPDKELCRYEFLELLVRMAELKYMKTKPQKAKHYSEALEKMIVDDILPHYKPDPW